MKFKLILEKDYKGKLGHQPPSPDEYPDEIARGEYIFDPSFGAPDDLFQHAYEYYLNTDLVSKADCRVFMNFLKKNQNKPNAKLTIYRGQPDSELDYGMWVTPFKSYAMAYAYDGAYAGEGSKVFQYEVKLHDLSCDFNSLAEWGYFGKPLKGKEVKS